MPNSPSASPAVLSLLERLSRGEASVEAVADALGITPVVHPESQGNSEHKIAVINGATVDLGRRLRCGFGEVIYGEGKSAELITEIIQTQLQTEPSALVTRVDPTAAAQLRRCFDHTTHSVPGRTLRVDKTVRARGVEADEAVHVAVVTAGSTDLPVAEEAIETLAWMGIATRRFDDVGVAGPARLLSIVPDLVRAEAIVVVAGMEGALPSVVGGHVAVPVFAVPTSVGYGAQLGGMTPLLGMLSSCASNVAVVNIDAGFKAAYLAGLVASRIGQASRSKAED